MVKREKLNLQEFMDGLIKRNPDEVEFHQAVEEVAKNIIPFVNEHPDYIENQIFERMTEPDRTIIFRVCWEDDQGCIRTNRGYRIQFNNAIGPYKGGLRFHPSVNSSILKFLGFEQTFKNSLTTLPMGSGKGGADFNPKGKSEREIMRFCQAFMIELSKHIGENVDIPAGDIGVGEREISFMFGQYKRLQNEFTGTLTGKSIEFGGSLIRKEATGYGCAYFMEEILKHKNDSIEGKSCILSGSGNVAQFTAQKILGLGGKVLTLSDSSGFIYDPNGLNEEKLEYIIDLKTNRRGRLSEFAQNFKCAFYKDKKPWAIKADLAFPCATQNEVDISDANQLIKNGCIAFVEGANMPTTNKAIEVLKNSNVIFAPGKAANAGGVSVSGLEMTQNSIRLSWREEELDEKLRTIMHNIHQQCVDYGKKSGGIDYTKGANLAGFVKVAKAMLAYGIV